MKQKFLLATLCLFLFLPKNNFAQTQLIQNGNFSSATGWTTGSAFWWISSAFTCYSSASGYAYVGNSNGSYANNTYGSLYQTITIPCNATSVTLSFKLSVNTYEASTLNDVLDVQLRNPSTQALLTTFASWSNLNGSSAPGCQAYQTYSYSIPSNYFGQSVNVNFQTAANGSLETVFRIDDVSVLATVPACTPVSIATNPQNQTANSGSTATYNVSVNGTPPFSYFWYNNSGFITSTTNTSSTSSQYITPTLTTNDNGNYYYCIVTNCNSCNQATSSNGSLTVNSPCTAVSIGTQPQNQTASVGSTATFSVSPNGTPIFLYQWRKNGVDIPSANSSSYTTPTLSLSDDGNTYSCYVTNCSGNNNATSNAATLTVSSPCTAVSIGTQPQNQTAVVNGTATFSVSPNGTPIFLYQWRKNGVDIPSANSSSYTTPSLSLSDNGNTYSCYITNCSGNNNATSNAATLTVTNNCTAVSIGTQPQNQTAVVNGTATFSVTPNGTSPFTYQWRKNGVDIPSANSSSYTTPSLSLSDNGNAYSCYITNCSGNNNVTSNAAMLTVTNNCTAVSIGTQPQNQTAVVNGTATFSVIPNGTSPFTYQWRKNGVDIPSANSSSYTTPTLLLSDNGNTYSCYITNCSGNNNATTNTATLTVTSVQAPTVTVTYPNGGETWTVGSSYNITGTITGGITGKQIEISYDGGLNWSFIWGVSNTSTTLSHSWIPSQTSSNCKIRISVFDQFGQLFSDVSNNSFSIVDGQSFCLDPVVSHLYWPYKSPSTFANKNGWGIYGSNHGQGGHWGSDYFAEDWSSNIMTTLGSDFHSPLSGTVIFVRSSCTVSCYNSNNPSNSPCSPPPSSLTTACGGGCSGYANTVVIQSSLNSNYVFKVGHLQSIAPSCSLGAQITAGQIIGYVGNTGCSTGPHAHCILYKNVNQLYNGSPYLSHLAVGGGRVSNQNFASEFIFDAVSGSCGGTGSNGNDESITYLDDLTLCGQNDSIVLFAPNGFSYFWNTGDTTSQIVVKAPGSYSVVVFDNIGNSFTTSIVNVTANSIFPVNISTSKPSLCPSDSITLFPYEYPQSIFESYDAVDDYLYEWSTGSHQPNLSITTTGTYKLTVTDGSGCILGVDSIFVTSASLPTQPTVAVNNIIALAISNPESVSYQWYFDNNPIDSATGITYTASATGYYYVVATNSNGCSSTSSPVYVLITSLDELTSLNNFGIYPNPNTGNFTVAVKSAMINHIELSCLNILGEEFYHRDFELTNGQLKTEINLSSVAKGLYIVRIFANGKSVYRKVTITD